MRAFTHSLVHSTACNVPSLHHAHHSRTSIHKGRNLLHICHPLLMPPLLMPLPPWDARGAESFDMALSGSGVAVRRQSASHTCADPMWMHLPGTHVLTRCSRICP